MASGTIGTSARKKGLPIALNANAVITSFSDVDHPVPMVVKRIQEEDSNQRRRVEIGQLKVPKTVTK